MMQTPASYLMQLAKQNGMSDGEFVEAIEKLNGQEKDMDVDYIKAVLFPEYYPPARVPSKFGFPSALFTHRGSAYISTGVNGNGALVFTPKDTTFCSCMVTDPSVAYDGNPTNSQLPTMKYLLESDARYIPDNYSQVRLVGASVRIQYIGVSDQESGILTGSHVFESAMGMISDEIIDNGYFVTRGRLREGLRLVWLPKDSADCEYYETNNRLLDADAANNQILTTADMIAPGANSTVVQFYSNNAWSNAVDGGGAEQFTAQEIYGMGAKKFQGITPDAIGITWRGAPANQTWFRVDFERHFEGIPRTKIRDIVAVARGQSSEDAITVVQKLSTQPELQSHTIETAEAIKQSTTSSIYSAAKAILNENKGAIATGLLSAAGTALGGGSGGIFSGLANIGGGLIKAFSGVSSGPSKNTVGGDTNTQIFSQGKEMAVNYASAARGGGGKGWGSYAAAA